MWSLVIAAARSRTAVAALAAVILATPIVVALAGRVPDEVDTPLVVESDSGVILPIELNYLDYPNGPGEHTAQLLLLLDELSALTTHTAIDLLVATNATKARLNEASIRIDGTACRFVSAPGAEYPNNKLLRLTRTGACDPLPASAGRPIFEVRFEGPGRMFVWSYRAFPPFEPGVLYAHDPAHVPLGFRATLRGRYVDIHGISEYRRIDLLAHMWQVAQRPSWIWAAITVSIVLFAAGVWILCGPSQTLVSRCLGAASIALGAASLYAVIVPPFQAPDEPSHFITYTDRFSPQLTLPANEWQKQGHFKRLQFHDLEKFKPVDVSHPSTTIWDVAPQPVARSVTGRAVIRAVHVVAGHLPLSERFLAARGVNSVLFAAATAFAAGALIWITGVPSAVRLTIIALSVPTAPFFAMHFSNYATLVTTYVLLSAAICGFVLDRRSAWWSGPMLGVSFGLALATSRSSVPLAAVVGALLLGRIVLGPRDVVQRKSAIYQAMLFWFGYGVALPLGAGVDAAHWQLLFGQASRLTAATAVGFHIAVVAIGCAAEISLTAIRMQRLNSSVARAFTWVARAIGAFAAACLIASMFVELPHLPFIDMSRPPQPAAYVRRVLMVGLLPFRVRDADFLLMQTFWGGFGWLDTILSPPFVNVLVTATSLSFVLTIARLRDVRERVLLVLFCAGGVVALAGYARGSAQLQIVDVVGRYVFGLYLTFVMVAWSWIVRRQNPPPARFEAASGDWATATLCLGCAAIHAYSLQFILRRYF